MNTTTAASLQPVSSDVFRSAFEQVFESASRRTQNAAQLSVGIMQSPVGTLMLAATHSALRALEFLDSASLHSRLRSLRELYSDSVELQTNDVLDLAGNQLDEYFGGMRTSFDVPVSYTGSAFQEKVWSALLSIGYGETWSYLELAEAIGDRSATRAVGLANGANPLAIVIPCHRVVNANGALGGYGGGSWRKRMLLDLERGQTQLLF